MESFSFLLLLLLFVPQSFIMLSKTMPTPLKPESLLPKHVHYKNKHATQLHAILHYFSILAILIMVPPYQKTISCVNKCNDIIVIFFASNIKWNSVQKRWTVIWTKKVIIIFINVINLNEVDTFDVVLPEHYNKTLNLNY